MIFSQTSNLDDEYPHIQAIPSSKSQLFLTGLGYSSKLPIRTTGLAGGEILPLPLESLSAKSGWLWTVHQIYWQWNLAETEDPVANGASISQKWLAFKYPSN